MPENDLADLLSEQGLPLAVVVNVANGNLLRVGCGGETEFDDLLNSLLGDEAAIQATNDSLQGQILPRIWGQGRLTCILCKPRSDTIVCIFCDKEISSAELYHMSTSLNADIDRLYS
jgi:hypothetical protein